MMICEADANSRVFPSGAAWATRVAPIAPLAPATFSTMTGWPSTAVSRSLAIRAMVSVFPPAAYGTTAVIGRAGQSPARAAQAMSASAPTTRHATCAAPHAVADASMSRRWQMGVTGGPSHDATGVCGRRTAHHPDAFSRPQGRHQPTPKMQKAAAAFSRGSRIAWVLNRKEVSVLGSPGSDLLFQVLRLSTIGAGKFDGRVRDGIGYRLPANTTRPAKDG